MYEGSHDSFVVFVKADDSKCHLTPHSLLAQLTRCVAGVESVWLELRHCHCLRNEMAHFCTDLQTYIMFEVLETAWDIFMAQLKVSLNCHAGQLHANTV